MGKQSGKVPQPHQSLARSHPACRAHLSSFVALVFFGCCETHSPGGLELIPLSPYLEVSTPQPGRVSTPRGFILPISCGFECL